MLIPILCFLAGILTIRYIIPLLDQLLAWALQAIEVKKGKLLVKQTECEKEISDIAITIDQPATNQIGFQIPLTEEEAMKELEEDENEDL